MLAKRSVIVKQIVNWGESDHEPAHFGRCDSSIVKTSAGTRQSRAWVEATKRPKPWVENAMLPSVPSLISGV